MKGLFLDFDGVLCDSVSEAYYSSYYYVYGFTPEDLDVPPEFRRLRSFIRNGEDFIFLQEIIRQNLKISNQSDFDSFRSSKDSDYIINLQHDFLKTRHQLLEEKPDLWLSLNPLFKGVSSRLKELKKKDNIFILSTKNNELIKLILNYNKIDWPKSRIINSINQDKVELIESYKDFDQSFFIDDQFDHLVWDNEKVHCYLALWGYLDQKTIPDVNSLNFNSFLNLLDTFIN